MSSSVGQSHPKRRLASSLCAVGLLLTGVLSLSAVALPTQEAGAATDMVTNCSGDPSTSGSLPNEIASAGTGDTITFALSPSCSTIDLASTIVISEDLTITGPGETSLAVDGGTTTEPFEVTSGTVTISGLTIQHGNGPDGGAIDNSGTLTVSNERADPQLGNGWWGHLQQRHAYGEQLNHVRELGGYVWRCYQQPRDLNGRSQHPVDEYGRGRRRWHREHRRHHDCRQLHHVGQQLQPAMAVASTSRTKRAKERQRSTTAP